MASSSGFRRLRRNWSRLKVNIIVTAGNEAVQVAQNATQTIPIVMGFGDDPVGAGLVDSLARPGGNITGLSWINVEFGGKRLELIKETVPRADSNCCSRPSGRTRSDARLEGSTGCGPELGLKSRLSSCKLRKISTAPSDLTSKSSPYLSWPSRLASPGSTEHRSTRSKTSASGNV